MVIDGDAILSLEKVNLAEKDLFYVMPDEDNIEKKNPTY